MGTDGVSSALSTTSLALVGRTGNLPMMNLFLLVAETGEKRSGVTVKGRKGELWSSNQRGLSREVLSPLSLSSALRQTQRGLVVSGLCCEV